MSFKLKNSVECPNCKHENPFYRLTCENCNSYLRSRVVNIDFWKTFWKEIESPGETFRKIIFAEHKNFTALILIFVSIKITLLNLSLLNLFSISKADEHFNTSSILLFTGIVIILFMVGELFVTKLNSSLGLKNRIKDNLAITIYSFVPLILSLLILTPIEYALFGNYWYIHNPSPFLIKPLSAYIIAGIEGIMIIWSLILLAIANYTQTKNVAYSVVVTIILTIILFALPIYLMLNINLF